MVQLQQYQCTRQNESSQPQQWGQQFNPIALLGGITAQKRGSCPLLCLSALSVGCWGTVCSAEHLRAERALPAGWHLGLAQRLSHSAHRGSSQGQAAPHQLRSFSHDRRLLQSQPFLVSCWIFYRFCRYCHEICILSIGILSSYWRIEVECLWNNSGFAGRDTLTGSWNWTIELTGPSKYTAALHSCQWLWCQAWTMNTSSMCTLVRMTGQHVLGLEIVFLSIW